MICMFTRALVSRDSASVGARHVCIADGPAVCRRRHVRVRLHGGDCVWGARVRGTLRLASPHQASALLIGPDDLRCRVDSLSGFLRGRRQCAATSRYRCWCREGEGGLAARPALGVCRSLPLPRADARRRRSHRKHPVATANTLESSQSCIQYSI